MSEIWIKIPNFPDEYEVSNSGRIRRLDGIYRSTFYGKPITRAKPAKVYACKKKSPKGYMRINLCGRVFMLHRLIAMAFIANPQSLPQVNHKNGNKEDNRPCNLEWVTNLENRQHAVDIGLHSTGPRRNARKYGDAVADQIKQWRSEGVGMREIGRRIGTGHGTIRKILSRQ